MPSTDPVNIGSASPGDPVELVLAEGSPIGVIGQGPTEQGVGVADDAALPWVVRIRRIDLDAAEGGAACLPQFEALSRRRLTLPPTGT